MSYIPTLSSPRVGVGVFLISKEDHRFIGGIRKGSHGAGSWALPGGHLEYGESFESCARREVAEETGIDIQLEDIEFLTAVNSVWEKDKLHYITIFMACQVPGSVIVKLLEPEKCEGWEWIDWKDFSSVIESGRAYKDQLAFEPLISLVRQRKDFHPSEELERVTKQRGDHESYVHDNFVY